MIYYVTKDALTQGILKIEGEISLHNPQMLFNTANKHEKYHKEGNEWHRTVESAQKRAEEMRLKKMASLYLQIEKLKKMSFKVVL